MAETWRVYVIRDAKGFYYNGKTSDLAKALDTRGGPKGILTPNGDHSTPPYTLVWSVQLPGERAAQELCYWLTYGIPTRDRYAMFHKGHRKFVYMRMLKTKVGKLREKYSPTPPKANAYGVRNVGAIKPRGRRGKHLRELIKASNDQRKDAS
jgi:predicted GIY-YIG superfamily endonuclease